MLVSNYSIVKVTSYNYIKLKKLYPCLDIKKDEILKIPIDLLSKGSGFKVKIKCNYCNSSKEVEYRKYIKDNDICCGSSKCIKQKRISTNIYKYGVDNPMKNIEIQNKLKESLIKKYKVNHYSKTNDFKEKVAKTNLERYGNICSLHGKEIKEKVTKTNLERYNTEHPSQSLEIKRKVKETNLERYGVDNPMKLDKFKEKVKETNLEKYGKISYSQTDKFKNEIKEYFLKKYGVDSPMKLDFIKNKIKETNIEKFNTDNYVKTDEYRKYFTNIANDPNYIKYLGDGISLLKCDLNENHNYEIHSSNYWNRNKNKNPLCTICYPISENVSIKEKEVLNYIKSIYSNKIISNYRDGLEIDIYLPDLNIGFEFNGLYWHSDLFMNKDYHLNKFNYFKNKNIDIIYIWEDEWIYKNDIIKSLIKNILSPNKTIEGNVIKEVSDLVIQEFINKNSIQNIIPSDIRLGYFHQDELISIMTFSKKENSYILNNFCYNKFDDLLNHFLNIYPRKSIISNISKNWLNYSLFKKFGFSTIEEIDPIKINENNEYNVFNSGSLKIKLSL